MIDNSPPDWPAAPDSFDPADWMMLGSSDLAGPAGLPGSAGRPDRAGMARQAVVGSVAHQGFRVVRG
jgi:hypothetical protein